MVTYKYRAQDENGKMISGTMQAADERDLHERLKQEKKISDTGEGTGGQE